MAIFFTFSPVKIDQKNTDALHWMGSWKLFHCYNLQFNAFWSKGMSQILYLLGRKIWLEPQFCLADPLKYFSHTEHVPPANWLYHLGTQTKVHSGTETTTIEKLLGHWSTQTTSSNCPKWQVNAVLYLESLTWWYPLIKSSDWSGSFYIVSTNPSLPYIGKLSGTMSLFTAQYSTYVYTQTSTPFPH